MPCLAQSGGLPVEGRPAATGVGWVSANWPRLLLREKELEPMARQAEDEEHDTPSKLWSIVPAGSGVACVRHRDHARRRGPRQPP
jgi:hypothetical protein